MLKSIFDEFVAYNNLLNEVILGIDFVYFQLLKNSEPLHGLQHGHMNHLKMDTL